MNSRTFNYRSPGAYAVVGFLLLWTTGWLFGVGANWAHPNVDLNGRPATPEQARIYEEVALVVGLAIGTGAVLACVGLYNSKVVINDNGTLSWFDWLGREKVQGGSIASAKLTEKSSSNGVKFEIETDRGVIKGKTTIRDYGILKTAVSYEQPSPAGATKEISAYVPELRTYTYRWSYMHLFSFVWLGGIAFLAYGLITISQTSQTQKGSLVPFILGLLLFASVGVWMQLVGWNESITLGPDGIEWIDFLGRVKVKAALTDIIGNDEALGSEGGRSFQIHTKVGTISGNSYLRGSDQLTDEVRKIWKAREIAAAS